MAENEREFLADVADYYTTKIEQFGETARGVDWNGVDGQRLRFMQLCKLIDTSRHFSVNDLGCGYGAFYDFLANDPSKFSYCGIDVSDKMIQSAERRCSQKSNVRFVVACRPEEVADYGVASGIFNVRLSRSVDGWKSYVAETLDALHLTSRLGFSFNCLTSYSDADKMQDYLYYADPCEMFDFCRRRYSRHVSLLHDYGLYEFTILVRNVP